MEAGLSVEFNFSELSEFKMDIYLLVFRTFAYAATLQRGHDVPLVDIDIQK